MRFLTLLLCLGSVPSVGVAQRAEPVSLDLALGMARGFSSGDYRGARSGLALHASASVALKRFESGALRAVVTADILNALVGQSDICVMRPPSTECVRSFPSVAGYGLGLAWQRTATNAPFPRIMLGAGRYLDDRQHGLSPGVQARVSLAEFGYKHIAGVVTTHALVLSRLHGDALATLSFTLGLRVR